MIITPDWAFIHIPRCAGFAVKEAYVDSGGSESHIQPILEGDVYGNMPYLARFEFWQNHVSDDAEVWAIVRNPYDRIQDCYNRARDLVGEENCSTFEQFLDLKNTSQYGPLYTMRDTQKMYIESDRPVRYYKLETELEQAFSDHGLILGDVVNAADHDDHILTDQNIEIINEIFHDDFVEFGYEKR